MHLNCLQTISSLVRLQGDQHPLAEASVGVAGLKACSQEGLGCPQVTPLLHLASGLLVSVVQVSAGEG